MNATPHSALTAAIQIAGSQAELARRCDVAQPTVWKWLHQARQVAAEHVLKVEAASGVSRHALRPDIYPLEPGSGETAAERRPPSPDAPGAERYPPPTAPGASSAPADALDGLVS